MKKRKLIIASVLILVIAAAAIIYGCFGNGIYSVVKENLSEVRYNVFDGENESVTANFMSGKRESEFLLNGESTPLINFGLITFEFKQSVELVAATYSIVAGEKTFEGALEINPYKESLVADIKEIIDQVSQLEVSLKMADVTHELTLSLVNENWKVDHEEALKIACKKLETQLKDFVVEGKFAAEAYVKIVTGQGAEAGEYFWYVNVLSKEGKNIAVIIDPMTKQVLATQK